MPIGQRLLRVVITMPQGPITLDETLDLKVKINKAALAAQQKCTITVSDLSASFRASLLSQFTLWNKRNIEQGTAATTQQAFVPVQVQAGYQTANGNNLTTIFIGQISLANPLKSLPNMAVEITAFTYQLSKLQWVVQIPPKAPATMTFKAYAQWVADKFGVQLNCSTSYDNNVITNPGATVQTVDALLLDVQNYYRPNVVAYIDNNVMYVRDVNKTVTSANTATLDEFIDMPLWTEWGVRFRCLFDPSIMLGGGAQLKSIMNPQLNQTAYVIFLLEYDLSSREDAFYVTTEAAPPA
jgi:hypothetical protein